MLPFEIERYRHETFHCAYCGETFEAQVTTWVDASRTPRVRERILRFAFNTVRCPRCGFEAVADTPFFYEDFEEGILVLVFPSVPDQPGEIERDVKEHYSYYPFIEFFYDMTQLWVLVYIYLYHMKNGRLTNGAVTGDEKDHMVKKIIRFIKTDGVMLHIREKMRESFSKPAAYDELISAVELSMFSMERGGMHPLEKLHRTHGHT